MHRGSLQLGRYGSTGLPRRIPTRVHDRGAALRRGGRACCGDDLLLEDVRGPRTSRVDAGKQSIARTVENSHASAAGGIDASATIEIRHVGLAKRIGRFTRLKDPSCSLSIFRLTSSWTEATSRTNRNAS